MTQSQDPPPTDAPVEDGAVDEQHPKIDESNSDDASADAQPDAGTDDSGDEPRPSSRWTKRKVIVASGVAGSAVAIVLIAILIVTANKSIPTYTIGVLNDEPGVNFQDQPTTLRSGFEISMYRWMADFTEPRFNYEERELTIASRDFAINTNNSAAVDFVVASYTITDDRLRRMKFAGPYLFTQQGVLVRRSGLLSTIQSPAQLSGRKVCAQAGSTSSAALRALNGVNVVEQTGLSQCIFALQSGQVDAVSTDQILLKGYAAKLGDDYIAPNEVLFGPIDSYGIAVKKDDMASCLALTERIRKFISSGSWDTFYYQNLGEAAPVGAKPDVNNLFACYLEPPPGAN